MLFRLANLLFWAALASLAFGCQSTQVRRGSTPSSEMLPRASVLEYDLVDEANGFSVKMPLEPTVQDEVFDTPEGGLRSITYTNSLSDAVFIVSINEIPMKALQSNTIENHLHGAKEGSIENTGGNLLQEQMITQSGFPGIEIVVSVNSEAYRTRIIIAGNRMYQMLVAADQDTIFSIRAEEFLDSLAIDSFGET